MILGALTGHARLSRALAWVGLVFAYLFFLTPQLAPGLKFIHLLSPFWYFFDANPLSNGVNLLHAAVLVLLTALTLIAALAIFEKADLMEAGD
jgi:FtsH-binding integral membrane protein